MFKYAMRVRDYECDLQKVVNNSVYQNYLEHVRHEFLLANAVDFAGLAEQGVNLMVRRVEIDFKQPLRSQDDFYVTVRVEKVSRIQYAFIQHIYRQHDNRLMASGKTIGLAVSTDGRPMLCADLDALVSI